MVTTRPVTKQKKEAINLYLTSEIVQWLESEAGRLMTSKAAIARIAIERAMRESEKEGRAA